MESKIRLKNIQLYGWHGVADKEKKMDTPYLWKNIRDAESSAVKIITVPKAKTGAYDLNNNKNITKDECALM